MRPRLTFWDDAIIVAIGDDAGALGYCTAAISAFAMPVNGPFEFHLKTTSSPRPRHVHSNLRAVIDD